MKVQLLHFQGCPNVALARAAARDAIAAERLDLAVEEIDVEAPAAPAWARGWGSPTILVDGEDVSGQRAPASSDSSACRLYAGGAPSVDMIRTRLRGARDGGTPPPQRGVAWPMIGAVTAAIAASACCVGLVVARVHRDAQDALIAGRGMEQRYHSMRDWSR